MNKIFLVVLIFLTNSIVFAQNFERWKPLTVGSEFVWDSESAKKIDAESVRFWYEHPMLEEQRNYYVKNNVYSKEDAKKIMYGRVGVIAKCKSMQYAIFSGTELSANKVPLSPGGSIPLSELKFNFIGPDTIMEGFVIEVCKYLKIK